MSAPLPKGRKLRVEEPSEFVITEVCFDDGLDNKVPRKCRKN